MKKLLLILLCLLTADIALASNMGFKLTYNLRRVAGTTGTNWVSLPYFWAGTTAKDVCNDIGPNASLVGHKDKATDLSTSFVCALPGPGFSITPGEAIFVRVSTDNTNWVIVGSHNDTLALNFRRVAGTTGTNWTSVPYHSTATTAKQLCTDIGPNASLIGHKDKATDLSTSFVCALPGPGFSLAPGEGVFIRVTVDNTSFTPSHY